MTHIEALARMPANPGTFTVAEYMAVKGCSYDGARKFLSRANADGLLRAVVHGGRGTTGGYGEYRRTNADLDAYVAERTERALSGGWLRESNPRVMPTPAARSVFDIAR